MNGYRQYFIEFIIMQTFHSGTNRTDNHWIHNLQMRWVERQRQVNIATFGRKIRREAHVIFHITGSPGIAMMTRELIKQLFRAFTQHVNQHGQSATMRHANDDFFMPGGARLTNNRFHHRDQHIAALQRKAFCTREFCTEITLQTFSGGQFL